MSDVLSFLEQIKLDDLVAMVTGAGHGFGRTIALTLARAGVDLVVVGNSGDEIEETAQEIETLGRRVIAFRADFVTPEEIEEILRQTVELLGRIDILVTHVGMSLWGTFQEMTLEAWHKAVGVHLTGLFLCCKIVGATMTGQGHGKMIHVLSVDGCTDEASFVAYQALKGGMVHFTKALAAEWGRYNIQINAVGPVVGGRVAIKGDQGEEVSEGEILAMRQGKPEDVSSLVLYLASPASNFITGETFLLGGPF